ncbi:MULTISPECIES: DUF4190 domain-containing protein [Brevibacterium]|jgi:uncharacterized membrane protein|uniref:DUF4190 domain-containing protein n=1 Tax=Brevibacterium linens ATCC 9172 TaxID=1255617 RepID=A0A2H1IIH4_BRELN|nr:MULTISPECIES: DUF4190 domain-containing protein [Brevibacterium]WGP05323.1 DUF4190 domain-containing protein [Bacillus subtilis]AZU01536.1 DUF4190 domain-containing protein [Brevibacterium linens]KAB1948439.1 DUF4190 domain-containing protein [Brevibacterium linens ATCC 9172]SMX75009.1 protein of unknown function (DUF4190) [Brevibacterium linens ATCC 9172]HJF75216.1 DUF4190 domain-containing protein [Brevibacterium linens]
MSSQNNWNNPDMYYQQPQSNAGSSYSAQSYSQNNAYAANAQYAGGPGYVYQQLPPTNVLAIVGMCASIFGVISSVFIGGIAGIIMGHIARKQIKERGERGDGMAIAALWVGYIGTILWILFWVFMILLYLGMFALIFAAEGAS